ncbi:540_t:CDS:2, partial [Entrophospora sp. SA101]
MDDYDYERYEDEIYKENVTDSESESSQNADNILAQIYYTVEKPKLTQQDPSKNNNNSE